MKKYDEMIEDGEGRSVKCSKNIMSNKMRQEKVKQYNFFDDRKEEGFVAE